MNPENRDSRTLVEEHSVIIGGIALIILIWIIKTKPGNIPLLISIIALAVAIVSNYDKMIKLWLYWRFDPDVKIGLSIGEPDQFIDLEPGSEIQFDQVQELDGDYLFGIAIENPEDKILRGDVRIETGSPVRLRAEEYSIDITENSHVELYGGYSPDPGHRPQLEYRFNDVRMLPKSKTRSVNFMMKPDRGELPVWRTTPFRIAWDVEIDASQWSWPFIDRNLPRNIGRVEFNPIEAEYTIIGWNHPDYESS